MGIEERKITQVDYLNKDVSSAPDRLTGTASENKNIFDRAVKTVVEPKYNALIEDLQGEGGAGNIGLSPIEGLTGGTVQETLAAVKSLIDNRYTKLESDTILSTQTNDLIQSFDIDLGTGVITVTKKDGSTETFDTAMEKIALDARLDGDDFVLTLADGTQQRVSLSSFIDSYTYTDSDTIAFTVSGAGNNQTVTAKVKNNSITIGMLSLEAVRQLEGYVDAASASATTAQNAKTAAEAARDLASGSKDAAKVSESAAASSAAAAKGSETSAEASKTAAASSSGNASSSATLSQSYAVGGTGTRAGEDTDNAKYYKEQAAAIVGGDYATKSELTAHTSDATVHVSAAEKEAWNKGGAKRGYNITLAKSGWKADDTGLSVLSGMYIHPIAIGGVVFEATQEVSLTVPPSTMIDLPSGISTANVNGTVYAVTEWPPESDIVVQIKVGNVEMSGTVLGGES